MEWFKKHTDLIIILCSFAGFLCWINSEFKDVRSEFKVEFKDIRKDLAMLEKDIRKDLAAIEKDISTIKAILYMKNIYPQDTPIAHESLAINEE